MESALVALLAEQLVGKTCREALSSNTSLSEHLFLTQLTSRALHRKDEPVSEAASSFGAVSLLQTDLVIQGGTPLELSALKKAPWTNPHTELTRNLMIVVTGVALIWALHQVHKVLGGPSSKGHRERIAGMPLRSWLYAVIGMCAVVAVISRFQWAYHIQDTAMPVFSIVVSVLWIGPAMIHWIFGRMQPAAWVVRCKDKAGAYVEFLQALPDLPEDQSLCLPVLEEQGVAVLGASLEHVLPHKDVKASAGGLGTVLGILVHRHPTPITLVHPMLKGKDYRLHEDTRDPDLEVLVDGTVETVKVYRSTSKAEPMNGQAINVTYLLLEHELFLRRPEIYPNCMTDSDALCFFSIWCQAVGGLLLRHKVHVFHCPDYHTSIAPLYALKELPSLRTLLILHNAAYHGNIATDMVSGQRLEALSRMFNLPKEELHDYCLHEGRFNMLRAAAEIIRRQDGTGALAVSEAYAKEVQHDYSFFRSINIRGLDNPMEEAARRTIEGAVRDAGGVTQAKLSAKLSCQETFGLNVDPQARLVVFLGRMVKQKGTDLIADITSWMLETFESTQLIFVGPVGDAHGIYTKHKVEALAQEERYKGRLYVCCKFISVPQSLYLGADFCFMPSRDEPFGYVDIEFAWRGALSIGASVGGLGKVPGFYYRVEDRENDSHLKEGLMAATTMAMECPWEELEVLRHRAMKSTFPVETWQAMLHWLTSYQICASLSSRYAANATTAQPVQGGDGAKRSLPTYRDLPQQNAFQPEMTMDELSATVETVLQERPETVLKDILVEAGMSNDMAYETSAISRALLAPVFGSRVRWVHVIISIGYITSPVAEMAVVLFVQQWITRAVPLHNTEATKLVAELRAATFVVHSLGSALGSAFWYLISRRLAPRSVLMIALLIEPPLLMAMYLSSLSQWSLFEEGRLLLLGCMFCHGASSASTVLFVVFNFMMTLAELRESAMIVAVLDSVKLFVTLALTVYVFSVMTIDVRIGQAPTIYIFAVVPLLLIVTLRSLSACPLVFAPRGYRDEVLPDLGLLNLGAKETARKYQAYVCVTIMECMNQIGSFPGLMIVVWWTLGGWTMEDFGYAIVSAAVILAPFFCVWAFSMWRSSSSEVGLILEAALYIPPTTPLLTLVIQEASSNRGSHNLETWAFGLSIAAFILKYIRNSALGIARFRLLKSQWHFAAFRTIEACLQSLCRAASPYVCAIILQQTLARNRYLGNTEPHNLHAWSFDAAHQRELANAITITALPFAIFEMFFQQMASASVRHDLSPACPPEGHPKVCPEHSILKAGRVHASSLLAAALFLVAAYASQVKMVGVGV